MIATSRPTKQEAKRAEMTAKAAALGLTIEKLPSGKFRVHGKGIDVWVLDLATLDHRDFETH